MRQMMRTIVTGGLISLSSLIGWAEDSTDWAAADKDEVQVREPATKSPTGLRSPSLSGLRKRNAGKPETMPRNYYQELFNGGEEATPVPVQPESKVLPGTPNVHRLAKKRITSLPVKPKTEEDVSEVTELKNEDWPSTQQPEVKHAEFGHDQHTEFKVRQTRVDVKPKTAGIPLPPARPRETSLTSAIGGVVDAPASKSNSVAHTAHESAISVQWVKKTEINVGQECVLELVVKNSGSTNIEQVAIDALIQSPVRLVSAKPHPVEQPDRLTWNLPALPAGSEQRIQLKLVPSRRGDLGLSAQVRQTNLVSAAFRVEEPLLKVALKGPTEVMLGESAPQMVTISNPGTGAAHEVKITARVSNGLEHIRGESPVIEMEIGTITPGESRTIRLPLTGIRGGEQTIQVTAHSSSSSENSNIVNAVVNVISPSLSVTAEGPALRYKGRNAKFALVVSNDGSVANNNVRLTQSIADGFQFVSADHGGQYDPSQKTISWFLGRLETDQSVQVSCELTAVALGEFTQKVWVVSDAGAQAETTIDTQVDGTPSLTVQVTDLDDPVEIGLETAYEIRVKNEGSKSATNVSVSCELPVGVQLQSAKGPTEARVDQRTLIFKPVSQLSPGQETTFRVFVKGMQPGDHRIKARVSSDSLEEPLLKEEQTKFYSDTRR